MRRTGLLLILALLTLGGCQCEDVRGASPWELGVGDDASVLPDVDSPDGDVCERPPRFQVSYFPLYHDGRGRVRAPQVTEGVVFSQDREGRVLLIDPTNGESRPLTPRESLHQLVAAADGKALAFRSDGTDEETWDPVIVSQNGRTETITDFSDRTQLSITYPAVQSARIFDGTRFGLVLENDPNRAPGWIGYYDGEESQEIHVQDWTRPPVSLTPDGLVFAGRTGPLSGGGNREIYRFTEGDGFDQLTDTEIYERNPTTAGWRVYWNHDGAVIRRDLQAGNSTVIHEGFCGPVDADGRHAAFVCLSDGKSGDSPSNDGPRLGDQLYLYDGNATRRVPTGGGWAVAPRVDGASVVWFEYDSRSAFSGGPARGELRYWHPGMSESTVIDPVAGPCLSCGALWPPINLSADAGVIAWNYAAGSEESPPGIGGGVATWTGGCE